MNASSTSPLWAKTASELVSDYRAGRYRPTDVLAACLERVRALNDQIRAICTLNPDAERAAREADDRIKEGGELRPLEGVPFVVKDVIVTKGLRTTFGSRIFENYVPEEDAISVERLLRAGGILLGKSNTPEFAHDVFTHNKLFGATRNPRNTAYTAGGSSGGTAAAIASGMAPIGLGTDLGGSIRVPSAMCGLVGLRPSTGNIPVYPADFGWDTLVAHVHGPMARSVRDIGLMMAVLSGPDARDPSCLPGYGRDYVDAAGGRRTLEGRRVAFSRDLNELVPVEPEIADLAAEAVKTFEQLGCTVVEDCFDASDLFEIIAGTRGFGMVGRYAGLLERHREMMAPHLVNQVEDATKLNLRILTDAERARTSYWHRFRRFMERYDYLVTPVIGAPAWRIGDPLPTEVGGKPVKKFYDAFRLPYAFSLIGVPAIAVPTRETHAGLPTGIQIVGHRFADEAVIEAAAAYLDRHQDWVFDPRNVGRGGRS